MNTILANKYSISIVSPAEEEEEQVKGKGKVDPKKGAVVEEPTGAGNALKVAIDIKNADEARRKLTLDVLVVY